MKKTWQIVSLAALYFAADALLKLALALEQWWIATGMVPLAGLFVYQAMQLYKNSKFRQPESQQD